MNIFFYKTHIYLDTDCKTKKFFINYYKRIKFFTIETLKLSIFYLKLDN
jgi:hypothetical protein